MWVWDWVLEPLILTGAMLAAEDCSKRGGGCEWFMGVDGGGKAGEVGRGGRVWMPSSPKWAGWD